MDSQWLGGPYDGNVSGANLHLLSWIVKLCCLQTRDCLLPCGVHCKYHFQVNQEPGMMTLINVVKYQYISHKWTFLLLASPAFSFFVKIDVKIIYFSQHILGASAKHLQDKVEWRWVQFMLHFTSPCISWCIPTADSTNVQRNFAG